MAATIHIPDDLLAELQEKAAAEGRSVDELAEDALRRQLARQTLERFKAEARRRRGDLTDEQVEEIVHRAVRDMRAG